MVLGSRGIRLYTLQYMLLFNLDFRNPCKGKTEKLAHPFSSNGYIECGSQSVYACTCPSDLMFSSKQGICREHGLELPPITDPCERWRVICHEYCQYQYSYSDCMLRCHFTKLCPNTDIVPNESVHWRPFHIFWAMVCYSIISSIVFRVWQYVKLWFVCGYEQKMSGNLLSLHCFLLYSLK